MDKKKNVNANDLHGIESHAVEETRIFCVLMSITTINHLLIQ